MVVLLVKISTDFVQRMFLSSYLYLHFPGLQKAVEDVQLHLREFSSQRVIQTEESTTILVKAFADQIAERLASERIDSGESMMTSFFQIAPRELRSITSFAFRHKRVQILI